MPYSKPAPGQPVVPYVGNKPMWDDLMDMLEWWKSQQAGGNLVSHGRCKVFGKNTLGTDMLAGKLAYIDSIVQPSASTMAVDYMQYSPIANLITPVWHTKIDKLVLLHKGIPAGQVANIFGPTIIPCEGTVGQTTDAYVMVDPTNPSWLKTSDAGIYGLVGILNEHGGSRKFLIVDTTKSQRLWRYELTAAFSGTPSTAAAKLLRMDGTQYAATCTISDPELLMGDQVSGDTGFCEHVGNKFIAKEAVC